MAGSPGRADAALILEEGAGYHVIAYEAGVDLATGTNVAWVVLRIETVTVSGQLKVLTTLVGVDADPGYTYVVKKAGGVNSPVELMLGNGSCEARFRADYRPGKTVVDGGALLCR